MLSTPLGLSIPIPVIPFFLFAPLEKLDRYKTPTISCKQPSVLRGAQHTSYLYLKPNV